MAECRSRLVRHTESNERESETKESMGNHHGRPHLIFDTISRLLMLRRRASIDFSMSSARQVQDGISTGAEHKSSNIPGKWKQQHQSPSFVHSGTTSRDRREDRRDTLKDLISWTQD